MTASKNHLCSRQLILTIKGHFCSKVQACNVNWYFYETCMHTTTKYISLECIFFLSHFMLLPSFYLGVTVL